MRLTCGLLHIDAGTAAGLGEAHQHGLGCSQGNAVPAYVPAPYPTQRLEVCQLPGQQALESQGASCPQSLTPFLP